MWGSHCWRYSAVLDAVKNVGESVGNFVAETAAAMHTGAHSSQAVSSLAPPWMRGSIHNIVCRCRPQSNRVVTFW